MVKIQIDFFSQLKNLVSRKLHLKMTRSTRIFTKRNKIHIVVSPQLLIVTRKAAPQNKGKVHNFTFICISEKQEIQKIKTKFVLHQHLSFVTWYFLVWPVLNRVRWLPTLLMSIFICLF